MYKSQIVVVLGAVLIEEQIQFLVRIVGTVFEGGGTGVGFLDTWIE